MTNSSTLPVPRSERLIGLVLCDTFQRFDLLKPAFEKKAMERNAIGMIINNMIDGNNGKYIYIYTNGTTVLNIGVCMGI